MTESRRNIPAGEFKAHCLRLLDQVARTGEVLIITKRGRPVAKVVPLEEADAASLRGSVSYRSDIVAPIDEPWEEDR